MPLYEVSRDENGEVQHEEVPARKLTLKLFFRNTHPSEDDKPDFERTELFDIDARDAEMDAYQRGFSDAMLVAVEQLNPESLAALQKLDDSVPLFTITTKEPDELDWDKSLAEITDNETEGETP